MSNFKDILSGLEQLKSQLENIDKNETADAEKKLVILAKDLVNIGDKELHEANNGLDLLTTELGNIGKREYSFMKIFGIEEDELVHSRFLAWMLNPLENHGLGSQFVETFLEKIASKTENLDLSDVRLSSLLVRTEVPTETSRLDISLMDPAGHFICVIENKISSREGIDQTKRLYKDNHGICPKELFIFLTLNGKEKPKDEHFLSLTYGEVLPMLKGLLDLSSDDTKYLIKNYVNTLEGLIMSEKFDGYSERTQLYYRFNKQIDEVKAAFEQDRRLLLSAFEEEIKKRKWWDYDIWGIGKTGTEVTFWKHKWYLGENDEEGPYFEVRPSTTRSVVYVSLLGYPSTFSQKFAPILKKYLEQKYLRQNAGDFQKTLTGVNTFLEKTLLFSFTERNLIQKTLTNLDEMVDSFGEIVERSIKEFRTK